MTFIHVEDLMQGSLFIDLGKEIATSGFSIVNAAR
jgi:hypothetical protein